MYVNSSDLDYSKWSAALLASKLLNVYITSIVMATKETSQFVADTIEENKSKFGPCNQVIKHEVGGISVVITRSGLMFLDRKDCDAIDALSGEG